MTLPPYRKITYKTKLDDNEVVDRLSGIVRPRKLSRFNFFYSYTASRKPYEGEVTPQQFMIRKVASYYHSRFSIPPVGLQINGTIHRNTDGTTIYVTMAPSARTFSEILLICGILLLMAFMIPTGNSGLNAPELLLFILFPLLGFWVMKVLIESKRSKKELEELFEAQIVEQ